MSYNDHDARADEDIVDVLTAISVCIKETGKQPDHRTPAEQIQGRRKIT